MNKDVLVSISGLQFISDAQESLEMITIGDYYKRNGKHYLLFNERLEGFDGVTQNTIKFHDGLVDITKKGVSNVHMVFAEKQKNVTYYDTPFGNLLIGLCANRIDIKENENAIDIKIDYSLDINYEFVSDCSITISVKEKENADIHLM